MVSFITAIKTILVAITCPRFVNTLVSRGTREVGVRAEMPFTIKYGTLAIPLITVVCAIKVTITLPFLVDTHRGITAVELVFLAHFRF